MTWEGIALRSAAFESPTLAGRLFGPGNEEVGGVFDRNDILGSFGTGREYSEPGRAERHGDAVRSACQDRRLPGADDGDALHAVRTGATAQAAG